MLRRLAPRRVAQGILRRASPRYRAREQQQLAPQWRKVAAGPLQGVEFFLPPPGLAAWSERIVRGHYEQDAAPTLLDLASRGGTLYDIGSHIGFFTCAWLTLGGSSVVAFEPVPANEQIVRATVARNGFNDCVQVQALALGDYNGQAALQVNEANLGATSMAFVAGQGGIDSQRDSTQYRTAQAMTVTVRRLDDLVTELHLPPPALIKLDVEGAEDRVLAGAALWLTTHKPPILCEVHNIDSGLRVAQQLTQLGYELTILGKHSGIPATLWQQPVT